MSQITKQKIIGYCRVSTDSQREERTIELQEEALQEFIKKNNYELVKIFKDDGVSGELEDRPALVKMFDYLEDNQEVCGVLIYKLDRLARDVRIQENIIYDLQEKRNKKIISIIKLKSTF